MIEIVHPTELAQWLEEKSIVLIDVREKEEYAAQHINEAHLQPLSSFNVAQLPDTSLPLVIYCRSGARSAHVCSLISSFDGAKVVYNLEGGILAWAKQGLPTVS